MRVIRVRRHSRNLQNGKVVTVRSHSRNLKNNARTKRYIFHSHNNSNNNQANDIQSRLEDLVGQNLYNLSDDEKRIFKDEFEQLLLDLNAQSYFLRAMNNNEFNAFKLNLEKAMEFYIDEIDDDSKMKYWSALIDTPYTDTNMILYAYEKENINIIADSNFGDIINRINSNGDIELRENIDRLNSLSKVVYNRYVNTRDVNDWYKLKSMNFLLIHLLSRYGLIDDADRGQFGATDTILVNDELASNLRLTHDHLYNELVSEHGNSGYIRFSANSTQPIVQPILQSTTQPTAQPAAQSSTTQGIPVITPPDSLPPPPPSIAQGIPVITPPDSLPPPPPPSTQPAAQPVIQPTPATQPTPTAQPAAQPAPQPTAQPIAQPAAQPTVQPVAQPTPTTQPTAQPAAQPAVQPAPQPVAQPTAQTASPIPVITTVNAAGPINTAFIQNNPNIFQNNRSVYQPGAVKLLDEFKRRKLNL